MDNRYLRLNIEEAFQIKKDINSSVNTFYSLSQKINAYKLLRRKEVVLKNKLKVSFSSLKSKIALMESTLPEEERKNVEYNIMQRVRQEKRLNPQIQKIPNVPSINSTNQRTSQNNKNNMKEKEPIRDVSSDLEEIRKKLSRFQ